MVRIQPRYALPVVLGLMIAGTSGAQVTASATDSAASASRSAATLADYERMAAQGDASAAERAGRIFYDGRTPDGNASSTDLGRARTYLAQAAKAGSASASALLERIDASIVPADDAGYVPPPYGC